MPWRARKAIGIGLPVDGDGCSEMVIGLDGVPQGVGMSSDATGEKLGSDSRPVPPITAMCTGSVVVLDGEVVSGRWDTYVGRWTGEECPTWSSVSKGIFFEFGVFEDEVVDDVQSSCEGLIRALQVMGRISRI